MRWTAPRWHPADLVPGRLHCGHDAFLSTAEAAARAGAAVADWTDRVPQPPTGVPGFVLVGGAGLLGSRIAAKLLDAPGGGPVVIVSRRPGAVARQWQGFAGPDRAARWMRDPRLVLVPGDIAAAEDGWLARVPRAGVVMHLAAAVHALAGWRVLAPVNLHGLRHSMRLARRDGALLQLASTLSVFVSSNAPDADREECLPVRSDRWLVGGYAQTKAAAEFALAGSGLRCQVIRYGLLVPEPGIAFPSDHFAPTFLAALRQAGAVPMEAEQATVDLTPVDGAAAAAIEAARGGGIGWRHWANGTAATLSDTLAAIEAAVGPFPRVSSDNWEARLRTLTPVGRTLLRAAFNKSGFLADDAARRPVLNLDLFQSTHRRFLPAGSVRPGAPPSPALLLPGMVASMLRLPGNAGMTGHG